MTKKKFNLTGFTFNKLTVIEFSHIGKSRHYLWKCSMVT